MFNVAEVNLEQSKKAPTPTSVNELGRLIEDRHGQPENAYSPIEVMLLGIITWVKLSQS